jgi:hypothetical protein
VPEGYDVVAELDKEAYNPELNDFTSACTENTNFWTQARFRLCSNLGAKLCDHIEDTENLGCKECHIMQSSDAGVIRSGEKPRFGYSAHYSSCY